MSSTAYMPNLNATINNGTILGNLTISGTGPSGGIIQNRMFSTWTNTNTVNIVSPSTTELCFTSQTTGTNTAYLSIMGFTGYTGTTGATGTFFVNSASGPQSWIVSSFAQVSNTNSVPFLKTTLKVTQNGATSGSASVNFIPTGAVGDVSVCQPMVVNPNDQVGVNLIVTGGTGAAVTFSYMGLMQV